MIRIDWVDGADLRATCPVCASAGPKRARLTVESPSAGAPLTLLDCAACGAAFYDRMVAADMIPPDHSGALKFYVEQGAGVDVMIEPLFQVDPGRVRRYLEVGCGFGYALDFARWAFGWEGRGVDPSPLAEAGRQALGLDIVPVILAGGVEAKGGRDIVFCSEVIEHVPDPRDFVRALGRHLAEDGALILTTPRADAVHPRASSATLLSVLSPGHHLVLFRAGTLRRLLEASGFRHVVVRESPSTLCAVASRHPYPRREGARVDRALYRRYLADRSRALGARTPVGLGFTYRLFKECVNGGDAAQAEGAFDVLRAAYLSGYGLDLDRPRGLELGRAAPRSFDAFARACPFNVTGVLYFRGIIEMNHRGDEGAALECFEAATAAGVAVRTALRSIGADDGETEHLGRLARVHAMYCLARLDPAAALRALERTEEGPEAADRADASGLPEELATTARLEVFVRLVNGGHYELADQLASGVAGALGLGQPGPEPEPAVAGMALGSGPGLSAAFGLAILALNHQGDASRAAHLFGLVHDRARVACTTDATGPVPLALLWPARYCQALALVRAGDGPGSRAAARSLLDPGPPGPDLPRIPADLRASARELLA